MLIFRLLIFTVTVVAVLLVIILVRWLNGKVAVLEAKEEQREVHNSSGISDIEDTDYDVCDDD